VVRRLPIVIPEELHAVRHVRLDGAGGAPRGAGAPRPQASVTGQRGQAIVELALAFPILMLLLLGIVGVGIYSIAAVQQASASNTIAGWSASNPGASTNERDAFAQSISACPATAVYSAGVVTVTLACPTIAGRMLPMLPTVITTTGTAFVPSPTQGPSPGATP
jgi:Flp pilus assembly protein TadG